MISRTAPTISCVPAKQSPRIGGSASRPWCRSARLSSPGATNTAAYRAGAVPVSSSCGTPGPIAQSCPGRERTTAPSIRTRQ
ncbi:hypothetical protein [Anaeromyxobacter oryzisoli]|uniref:hypothetical protein n=1 Tax=Anaeromyxobacter oryzisoli TaxID=2925408 RepID=UPI001F55D69A|nr:hypothetical protein [Anaeromyxobacter sp. SG63]